MKNLKPWGILLIVMAISASFIAVNVDFDDVGNDYSSDIARDLSKLFPIFIYFSIAFCFFLGTYFIIISNKPEEKYYVKVLAVNKGNITVEFENGTRKIVSNMLNKPIVTGDMGIITLKGNVIAKFESHTPYANRR